jgi:large repetitive protein
VPTGTFYSANTYPNQFTMWKAAGPWSDSTITWNNQPGHTTSQILGATTVANDWVTRNMVTWVSDWVANPATNYGFTMDTQGQGYYLRLAADESYGQGTDSYLSVSFADNTPPAPAQADLRPLDQATLLNLTPTLTIPAVVDPDGDPVSYMFRVGSGSTGLVPVYLDSGWISTPSYAIPPGALRDGMSYSWRVYVSDPWNYSFTALNVLRVNLRLGQQAVSPMDSVGPATVNLATGNLVVSTSSPTFETVGGSAGLSYTYNSLMPKPYGLRASYWNNCNGSSSVPPGGILLPTLNRIDSQIAFDWGTSSPAPPGIDADNFCGRWTGTLTVPSTGVYCFEAIRDDGVRIVVNGTTLVDSWVDGGVSPAPWGAPGQVECLNLGAVVNTIQMDYYEHLGAAGVELWVKNPAGATFRVPAEWLTPAPAVLPAGWTLSAGSGGDLMYTEAQIQGNSIVLLDPSGGTHEFRMTDLGGQAWTPPPGEDATLTPGTDATGGKTYDVAAPDGYTYTFNGLGKLVAALAPTDDKQPAAAKYNLNASGQVGSIQDPVSGRLISLDYSPASPACPSASGFDAAPAGMLCRVRYWDTTQTDLLYVGGRLARLIDPGGEVTDFGYDSAGRIVRIRDPTKSPRTRHPSTTTPPAPSSCTTVPGRSTR